MAETLTYDPTPADAPELTPEEQDSLQVGEKMAEEEQQLLAGKFQSSEELEKAYVELQKKLGEKSNEDSESTGNTQSSDKETDQQEKEETEKNIEQYLEDGKVNYESVNEAYGEQLGNIFKNSEIDPWSISEHFHENNGTITEDMYQSLEGAGLSRGSIDAYLAGRAIESGYIQGQQEIDVSESDINSIQNSVGGKSEYTDVIQWASSNLEEEQIKAFDDLISTGNVPAIKLAVAGLKSQYDNANGYEGRMLSGKSAKTAGDVFRSQAEVVQAMSDPRYEKDEAYRNDIFQKLERSNINF